MLYGTQEAEEISRELTDRISSVVSCLYPSSVVKGPIAYCNPKSMKDLGSFQVYLENWKIYKKGHWNRWSQRIGGGPLNLACYALTGVHRGAGPYAQAFEWARRFLGLTDTRETERDRHERERRIRERQAEAARAARAEAAAKAARLLHAGHIWHDSAALDRPESAPARSYLERRGILVASALENLRAHAALPHPDAERMYPALVARVSSVDDQTTAIWRIYLTEDGQKAPVSHAKLGLGPAGGGAVRLGGQAKRIGIAEGIETALSVMALQGAFMPVWACLSTGGMVAFDVPPEVEEVQIFADADRPRLIAGKPASPGLEAANALKARLVRCGIAVRIVSPPVGMDFNDLLIKTKAFR